MRYIIYVIFFHLSLFAQTDSNISVISAEKLNVVYRGVKNPLKITVPGAKSFTATAPGLVKDSIGNYILSVGEGKEVKIAIDALMEDDTNLHEEEVFRIKGLSSIMGTFNGSNCHRCIVEVFKTELSTATIGLKAEDMIIIDFDSDYWKVSSFDIVFSDTEKIIHVEGNKFSPEAIEKIEKLKPGSIFYIINIKYPNPGDSCRFTSPSIKLMISNQTIKFSETD